MNWVLIWFIATSSGAVATGSTEFETEELCRFAMQEALAIAPTAKAAVGCYPITSKAIRP